MEEIDPYTTPALMPPPGVIPDFVHSYTLQPYLILAVSLCLTCTICFLIARVFTQLYLLRRVQKEDYLLGFAQAGYISFAGVMIAAGSAGQGRHQWDVSIVGAGRVALLANITEIVYGPAMVAAKLAILLQIRRIFSRNQIVLRGVQVLALLNILAGTAIVFACIFACYPRAKIMNPMLPGKCISTPGSIVASASINVVSDFTILLLPLLGISRLHMPVKRKVSVGAVFATGSFACIASIVRLVYSARLTQTKDVTWAIAPVGLWAHAEFATVIMVGCFPVLPRLFGFLSKRDQNTTAKTYTYTHTTREGAADSAGRSRAKRKLDVSAESGFSTDGLTALPSVDDKYIPLGEQNTFGGSSGTLQREAHIEALPHAYHRDGDRLQRHGPPPFLSIERTVDMETEFGRY